MQLRHIVSRVKRLETLSAHLNRERFTIQSTSNPLLYVEWRDYLAALRLSIQAIEAARAALVKAKQRLESESR
jgi:hypothetical protein